MLQVILTIIIVVLALGFAVYRLIRFLKHPVSACDGCGSDCMGCSLEELKKEIHDAKSNTIKNNSN